MLVVVMRVSRKYFSEKLKYQYKLMVSNVDCNLFKTAVSDMYGFFTYYTFWTFLYSYRSHSIVVVLINQKLTRTYNVRNTVKYGPIDKNMVFLSQLLVTRPDKLFTTVYEFMFIRKLSRTATITPLFSFRWYKFLALTLEIKVFSVTKN